MIKLKLPDGSVREHEKPLDGLAFAESIAKSLAKKAVAIKLDGEMERPLDRSSTAMPRSRL